MLATPAISHSAPTNGPRPINLRKDKGQIIQLLNLTFGHRQRRIYAGQINLSFPAPWSLPWLATANRHVPGFVWEQSGEILGNVSLVETKIKDRYIIANVAVHPKHQRQGIARRLMARAIDYIIQNRGQKILLQVEPDNIAAIQLYLSLGFTEVGTVNHWSANKSDIRLPDCNFQRPRSLNRKDWLDAYHLDRQVVHPDLNWPIPLNRGFFKVGILRRFVDLLNGQKLEGWVFDDPSNSRSNGKFAGLITLFSDWGRPTSIRLRVRQDWQGEIEQLLLLVALDKLINQRIGSAIIRHLVSDLYVNELLAEANFRIKRALTTMRLYLNEYEKFV